MRNADGAVVGARRRRHRRSFRQCESAASLPRRCKPYRQSATCRGPSVAWNRLVTATRSTRDMTNPTLRAPVGGLAARRSAAPDAPAGPSRVWPGPGSNSCGYRA
jgi:hypothetical protein